MNTEPERPVELGKDRVRDAPEVADSSGGEPWGGIANPVAADDAAPYPPPPAAWGAVANPGPPVGFPPYPPPPPGPMFPAPGYPAGGNATPIFPAAGYPPPGRAPYGAPGQFPAPLPPGYGYQDNTPVWSIVSFCCVAASVLGGMMLCGLPVLVTAPTGIVLGLVGHAKGESMGKWAATANGVVAALAAILVVVFVSLIGGV